MVEKGPQEEAILKPRRVPDHFIQALNTNSLQAGISGRVPLCHTTHSPVSGWKEAAPIDSPTLQVHLEVHTRTYSALHLALPMINPQHHKFPDKVPSVADSGWTPDYHTVPLHISNMLQVRAMIVQTTLVPSWSTRESAVNLILATNQCLNF